MEEEDGNGEEKPRNYSEQLDTPERRCTFAQRLREALDRAQSTESLESSYAVGISVTGSSTADNDIRCVKTNHFKICARLDLLTEYLHKLVSKYYLKKTKYAIKLN